MGYCPINYFMYSFGGLFLKMNRQDVKILILVGWLCLMIGILVGLGVGMIPENKCIKNPLYYGISSLETSTLKVTCYCNFNDFTYQPFSFNKTGVFALK